MALGGGLRISIALPKVSQAFSTGMRPGDLTVHPPNVLTFQKLVDQMSSKLPETEIRVNSTLEIVNIGL
ncbi:hypothetical protein TNCV_4500571 [Trichonephila clavipes]|nr:hypothetical protein TNCV_4500571 [Trichonephila clavipes]